MGSWEVGHNYVAPKNLPLSKLYKIPPAGVCLKPVLVVAHMTCVCRIEKHAIRLSKFAEGAGPVRSRQYADTSESETSMTDQAYTNGVNARFGHFSDDPMQRVFQKRAVAVDNGKRSQVGRSNIHHCTISNIFLIQHLTHYYVKQPMSNTAMTKRTAGFKRCFELDSGELGDTEGSSNERDGIFNSGDHGENCYRGVFEENDRTQDGGGASHVDFLNK